MPEDVIHLSLGTALLLAAITVKVYCVSSPSCHGRNQSSYKLRALVKTLRVHSGGRLNEIGVTNMQISYEFIRRMYRYITLFNNLMGVALTQVVTTFIWQK